MVLTCNNIVNIQTEWPLKQTDFDRFILDKYETYEKLNEIHQKNLPSYLGSILYGISASVAKTAKYKVQIIFYND